VIKNNAGNALISVQVMMTRLAKMRQFLPKPAARCPFKRHGKNRRKKERPKNAAVFMSKDVSNVLDRACMSCYHIP